MAHRLTVLLALVLTGALGACGGASAPAPAAPAAGGWAAVLAEAEGQTVRWWMYGGDPKVNAYVDDHVKPAAARLGVRLQVVPISDTADAVNRVVAERKAGRRNGGGVDLIWINGENFAAGKAAGLWRRDWVRGLPNARAVDLDSPLMSRDFQVPVDGQEVPWSRAAFVFAADTAKVRPPRTFPELLTYAKANPGRVAYPAPPDFTGSAFVRQVVQRFGSRDAGLRFLRELKPFTYKRGRVQPKSEQELSRLFADGQVDLAMSYDASFVSAGIARRRFPETVRPFLIGGGALQNTSFVTIPANAAHAAGAQVVANLLLSPELQAIKQDPRVLGVPTVLDLGRLDAADRRRFDLPGAPGVLRSFGTPLPELPAAEVPEIEAAWQREVQR